jgi:hypothetical protein
MNRIHEAKETANQFSAAGVEDCCAIRSEETEPMRQIAQIPNLRRGAGGHVQKIEILAVSPPRTSFNNVRRRGHRGASDLGLQAVALFEGKVLGSLIDIDHQAICEFEHAECAMVSGHAGDGAT